jgi:hypothetical protein
MVTIHSLENLKQFHAEATKFFASQLMLLKEAVPKIVDDRLSKAAMLLMSCGQTGAALLQLASQTDTHTSESVMLARAFMEKITNFCYVGICDEKEYRAFLLHPVYKHYHNLLFPRIEDSINSTSLDEYTELVTKKLAAQKEKQEALKRNPLVMEALSIFSDTKATLNWTRKTMSQRIDVIAKSGKLMDVFFTLNKIQYYSDASETLHGSLYGCTYSIGVFDPELDHANEEELNKKLYKDSTCMLLHLGTLIHESLTLISYTNNIKDVWHPSYNNRRVALNLLFHVLGKTPKSTQKGESKG